MRPRSRWRARATAHVITAGMGLAAVAAAPLPARAENNGLVASAPLMGWCTWNSVAYSPSTAKDEAEANALVSSGLKADSYDYVNQDDFWYGCPGSQGPDVDAYGRWVTNASEFPPSGSTNGIQVFANHVHSQGLEFGLYVTPGISDQAVSENAPIEGTSYTADEIANGQSENNYNCGGMQGIDYSKPGAQAFINSWANELASWGIDYLNLDGVGSGDIPDVQAWSTALKQTGRGIMDQSASLLCAAGYALLLDCGTLETFQVPFDPAVAGVGLLIINTRASHAHARRDYARRRAECEEAARQLGVRFLGSLSGADEASRLADPVLRRRARHVITDNARVLAAVDLLRSAPADPGVYRKIGALLSEAHRSLRDDFEVSWPQADVTVDAAIAAGALGARMIGRGFGGSVLVLVPTDAAPAVRTVVTHAFAFHGWAAPQFIETVPSGGASRVDLLGGAG